MPPLSQHLPAVLDLYKLLLHVHHYLFRPTRLFQLARAAIRDEIKRDKEGEIGC